MKTAGVGTVVRPASVPDSREPMVPAVDDPFDESLWRGLVMVPVGCLLIALLCAGMLSRLATAPVVTSSAAAAERDVDPGPSVATFYEVEEAGSLLRFDVALAR
jgi:hypothetical protein